MKKRNSKNRHFSKGVYSHKRLANRKESKNQTVTSAEVQLAEKKFKWSRVGIVIQLADFLIDKVPRIIKWLVYLLGMG